MHDLAVIIVTWNVRALALDAIRSVRADLAESGLSARIIVVDSASSDGTPDAVAAAFPDVAVIASPQNLGFGAANNVGLRHVGFCEQPPNLGALPRAVYLLNPDTITHPGATRALFDVLISDARRGLVGARLTFGDGSFQHSAFMFPGLRQLWVELFPHLTPGRFFESAFNGRYPRARYEGSQTFPVDFVLGATFMVRRDVVLATGGFDEGFFMYSEEIDWAKRIRDAGWSAWCVPAAHVTHLGGQSSGQVRPQSTRHLWTSRLRYLNKHAPPLKRLAARLLIAVGMTQMLRGDAARQSPELAAAYRDIRRLALRGQPHS